MFFNAGRSYREKQNKRLDILPTLSLKPAPGDNADVAMATTTFPLKVIGQTRKVRKKRPTETLKNQRGRGQEFGSGVGEISIGGVKGRRI